MSTAALENDYAEMERNTVIGTNTTQNFMKYKKETVKIYNLIKDDLDQDKRRSKSCLK
jgi:hypothetical protein